MQGISIQWNFIIIFDLLARFVSKFKWTHNSIKWIRFHLIVYYCFLFFFFFSPPLLLFNSYFFFTLWFVIHKAFICLSLQFVRMFDAYTIRNIDRGKMNVRFDWQKIGLRKWCIHNMYPLNATENANGTKNKGEKKIYRIEKTKYPIPSMKVKYGQISYTFNIQSYSIRS